MLGRSLFFRFALALAASCAALASLPSCASPVQVRSAFDPGTNFSKYHTFAMLEPNQPVRTENAEVNPFVLQRLRQIVYSRLVQRGYVSVERDKADIVVHVLAGVKERLEVDTTSYYGYAWRAPAFNYTVSQHQEGTVVIDLIDHAENIVVWRGTGVRRVISEPTNAELAETVDRILSQFPPQAAKP